MDHCTTVAAFGSWPSPVSAELLTEKTRGVSEPRIHNGGFYWLESRPDEGGRCTIVTSDQGLPLSLVPEEFSVRTGVHEYGGGAWTLGDNHLYFVNQGDQRIHVIDFRDPRTPEVLSTQNAHRYADLQYNRADRTLIAVVEDHADTQGEPRASLVSIDCSSGAETQLVSGADFYSNPRLSPDSCSLLWLQWNHPQMPWTANELWTARLDDPQGSAEQLISGQESLFQPQWSPDGEIYYVSDRSNWWNLYHYHPGGEDRHLAPEPRECGLPLWQFGMSTWGFTGRDEILALHVHQGIWSAFRLNLSTLECDSIPSDYSQMQYLATDPTTGQALAVCASSTTAGHICEISPAGIEPVGENPALPLPVDAISTARSIAFNTTGGATAQGFYYPPHSVGYTGPDTEKPPLIVMCHGGPTSATNAALNIQIQFWTSRGFAVADINYRGSTGYGRDYRLSLDGNWGIHDVDDACAAAGYCVSQGWADPERLIIRGGSAGGYTVLSALCFRDMFSAGCSRYGIGDLQALCADTHKFESRYTDSLVGPPSETHIYDQRSPIKHTKGFNCPIIFFQGMEDRVVPPEQARTMFEALREADITTSLVTYNNEGHGFRTAGNIIHALNAELAFYGTIFGFETDSTVTDLRIANLDTRQPAG